MKNKWSRESKMKKKIVFINPDPDPIGGISHATQDFAEALSKKGYDVKIIVLNKKRDSKKKINNIEIYELRPPFRKPLLKAVTQIMKTLKLVKKLDPDIVYGQTIYPGGFISMLASKLFGYTSIAHARGADVNDLLLKKNILIKFPAISAMKYIDYLFVLSLDHKNKISYFTKQKIHILPNGIKEINISNNNLKDLRKKLSIDEKFCILYAGRLLKWKGVHLLLKAISDIEPKNNITLFILGDGPEKNNLIKLAQNLGISNNVKFLGLVPRANVFEYMAACDIVVFPDLRAQGLGNAVLEAMYLKKPIVGTNVGYFTELINNGVNGLLVNPDTNSIKMAIIKLLRNDDLRKNLGENAYKTVTKKYLWNIIVDKFEKIVG